MNTERLVLSLSPWIVFSVLCLRGAEYAVGIAALIALAIAVALCIASLCDGRLTTLDAAAVVVFAAMSSVSFLGGSRQGEWFLHALLASYGRAVVILALGIVMLVSALAAPFSRQYVRPGQKRGSRIGRAQHRAVSLAWSGAVLMSAFGAFLAGAVGTTTMDPARITDLALDWALPIVAGGLCVSFGSRVLSDRGSPRLAVAPAERADARFVLIP